MIGLIVLFVFGVYLTVSALVIFWAARFAKKKGRSPWLGGILAALVMYNLVFWDFIPVLINHHRLCKEQGGFWVYKTPEQWFKENPDTIGKNWGDKWNALHYEYINGISRAWLSDRIYLDTYYNRNYAHGIRRSESRLVDAKTGEVLAHMIDFERGGGNFLVHAESFADYKFWLGMGKNTCCVDGFGKLITKYKSMGRRLR